jgi:NTP pyrophosphatase (non-canonical NTP hydrolase)
MHLNEYQAESAKTAIYDPERGLTYTALGVAGEAGEVADLVKKSIRDDNNAVSPERKDKLELELGDVMWYVANLAREIGSDLETIGQRNIEKLRKRQEEDKLKGSGDYR